MVRVKVRKMGEEDYGPKIRTTVMQCCGPGIGFPLLLMLIGVWLIGRDLGWWHQTINIWGIILLTIGIYWLLKRILNR